MHNLREINYYANIIYIERNSLFMKDSLTGKWYGTSENLFKEATYYATKTNTQSDISNFFFFF